MDPTVYIKLSNTNIPVKINKQAIMLPHVQQLNKVTKTKHREAKKSNARCENATKYIFCFFFFWVLRIILFLLFCQKVIITQKKMSWFQLIINETIPNTMQSKLAFGLALVYFWVKTNISMIFEKLKYV